MTKSDTRLELTWNDGDMPYSPAFGDHFYCREDGRLECGHVFLAGNGLPRRFETAEHFTIGELGFGTGLNAMETWRQWTGTRHDGATLRFISHELYPMPAEAIDRALSRWPELDAQRRRLVAAWPETVTDDVAIDFGDGFQLLVRIGDALQTLSASPDRFDAFYLDGFAPSRNPDLWSLDMMRDVHDHLVPGGTFATYAAAGFVRRNLQAVGFAVNRSPGFAGKREMLSGWKGDEPGARSSLLRDFQSDLSIRPK